MTATNNQLVLFGGISEATARFFAPKDVKDANGGIVGTTYGLIKRKDVAKALDLDVRKQSGLVDKAVLGATDAAKADMVSVAMKLGQSPDWTGGRLTVRKSPKSGLRSATMRFVEVKRDVAPTMTPEQISAATGIPVAEIKARMEAEAKKQAAQQVDITITESKPTPAAEVKK